MMSVCSTNSTQVGLYTTTNGAIDINEARKGLDCKCVCLDCHQPLKAVKDFVKVGTKPYFQHHNPNNNSVCNFSGRSRETELHLKLKSEIARTKQITLPPIYITKKHKYQGYKLSSFKAYKGSVVRFDEVLIEKRADNIIPDCIGIIGGRRLFIEVKVTHGVDEGKLKKIKAQGASCVELYAPKSFQEIPPLEVVMNPDNYEWITETRTSDEIVQNEAMQWFEQEEIRIDHLLEEQHLKEQERKRSQIQQDERKRDQWINKIYSKTLRSWDSKSGSIQDHVDYFTEEFKCHTTMEQAFFDENFPIKFSSDIESIKTQLIGNRSSLVALAGKVADLNGRLISALIELAKRSGLNFDKHNLDKFRVTRNEVADLDFKMQETIKFATGLIMDDLNRLGTAKYLADWLASEKANGRGYNDPEAAYIKTDVYREDLKKVEYKELGDVLPSKDLDIYSHLINQLKNKKTGFKAKEVSLKETLAIKGDALRTELETLITRALGELEVSKDDIYLLVKGFEQPEQYGEAMEELKRVVIKGLAIERYEGYVSLLPNRKRELWAKLQGMNTQELKAHQLS